MTRATIVRDDSLGLACCKFYAFSLIVPFCSLQRLIAIASEFIWHREERTCAKILGERESKLWFETVIGFLRKFAGPS